MFYTAGKSLVPRLSLLGMLTVSCGLTAIGDPVIPMSAEDIYAHVLPSIVTLKVQNTKGKNFTGTAFLAMDQDVAVTAWHVVHDAVSVTALFADGETRPVAGLIDKDEHHDLALISLASGDRPLVKLAQAPPRVGSKTYVIGAPRGFGFSIADGLLSQIQYVDGFPQYQVSCPFSTGSSGSPVLNARAEAIGAASWSKLHAQNLNFAIPSELILQLDPYLPVIPWVRVPTAIFEPSALEGSAPASDEGVDVENGLEALRNLLKTAAGQPITVVIRGRDKPERSFSFVMPP
jgi:S1-C subfamily serine protease